MLDISPPLACSPPSSKKKKNLPEEARANKMLRGPQQLRSGGRGGAPRFALEQEEQEGGRMLPEQRDYRSYSCPMSHSKSTESQRRHPHGALPDTGGTSPNRPGCEGEEILRLSNLICEALWAQEWALLYSENTLK